MSDKHIDELSGVATTGHEWDGIRELDNPMPRWWLWTFYASIVWAAGYVVLYPAWPMLNSATQGVLGWTSRGALDREMEAQAARRAPITSAIAATALTDLPAKPELMQAAAQGGAAAFRVHGRGMPQAREEPGKVRLQHLVRTDEDAQGQGRMPLQGRLHLQQGLGHGDIAQFQRQDVHGEDGSPLGPGRSVRIESLAPGGGPGPGLRSGGLCFL